MFNSRWGGRSLKLAIVVLATLFGLLGTGCGSSNSGSGSSPAASSGGGGGY